MSRRSAIGGGVRPPESGPMALIYGDVSAPPEGSTPLSSEATPVAVLSVRVEADLLERARDLAYWDRRTLVEIVEDGIRSAVLQYEEEQGPLAARPRRGLRGRRPGAPARNT